MRSLPMVMDKEGLSSAYRDAEVVRPQGEARIRRESPCVCDRVTYWVTDWCDADPFPV
jgi:hypothetical protein